MRQVVSYVRVSTQRQGSSGLGLEAQRAAVQAYCDTHGAKVLREFKEVESGKNNDRAVLREALTYAKQQHTLLVIGKLDRLARNVAFIANLMESGVEFAACDVPEANRLLLHIMAAVAEAEGKAISDRTVAALQAAKAHGKALGATNPNSRNLSQEDRQKGAVAAGKRHKADAVEAYAELLPIIQKLKAEGQSLNAIAEYLNGQGHQTRTGAQWSAVQVLRALKRGV